MLVVCLVGMVVGFLWALLGTRMWHYHLEYSYQLRRLWVDRDDSHPWREVDEIVRYYWRSGRYGPIFKAVLERSGNQWVLFGVPILLAFVHLMMWLITVLVVIEWPARHLATWPEPVLAGLGLLVFSVGLGGAWKVCRPVLAIDYERLSGSRRPPETTSTP